ncbi:hypothetical protein [Hyphomicrobium sp.]|uniref:hypothetical protein n=1 Tax=Hyphomicrobium sp. TaxID=82 RepID=UPI0025B9EF7A|nr:hypothetical protein [Hyphomicrobium sp.]MCC7250739.1 hypothetical protein [Hyphomicrobium sp.]
MARAARGIRIIASIAALCVLATAGQLARAGDVADDTTPAPTQATVDLAGRWEGRSYEMARAGVDCGDKPCMLTLDLARCGDGWCGIEVIGREQRCGATALRLDAGAANPGGSALYKGKLELAKGTEPYVVEAYLMSMAEGETQRELQIVGDTGGEFRMFRRSFPFNATLARISEARCQPESTVSLLD